MCHKLMIKKLLRYSFDKKIKSYLSFIKKMFFAPLVLKVKVFKNEYILKYIHWWNTLIFLRKSGECYKILQSSKNFQKRLVHPLKQN